MSPKRPRHDVLMEVRGPEKMSMYHLVRAATVIMREQRGREPTADEIIKWLTDDHDAATIKRWRRAALDMQRAQPAMITFTRV